jgi:Protein of unknown function (DUF3305)
MSEPRSMDKPSVPVAVVMERRPLRHRWQSEVWEAVGVIAHYEGGAGPRVIFDDGQVVQWLHPGLKLELHRDEAEGYYLNVSTAEPRVFVMWRMEEEGAVPEAVSASYHDAGMWMDASEQVSSVSMAPDLVAWVREYVARNYRPEPKQRRRPQSFIDPKDRAKS